MTGLNGAGRVKYNGAGRGGAGRGGAGRGGAGRAAGQVTAGRGGLRAQISSPRRSFARVRETDR